MKKLMFAAAVVAAGVAVADVTTDIIGYQNKELKQSGDSYVCDTFKSIGKELNEISLGDFNVPETWEFEFDYVALINPNGILGQKYTCVTKKKYATEHAQPELMGWWEFEDASSGLFVKGKKDDVSIPFGTAFVVHTESGSAAITFSGEVLGDDYGIPLGFNSNTFTGIVCPADVKIGDLMPKNGDGETIGWAYDTDYIARINSNGTLGAKYTYVTPYMAVNAFGLSEDSELVGWWDYEVALAENFASSEKVDDSVDFKAGDAIMIYTGAECELVIPSAIP